MPVMQHASHPGIIKRLKRAQGHLASTIAMFEEDRPCLELAQQLHAVESAVASAKREMIHDHVEHCLKDGSLNAKDAIKELKALTKYLER
jgi:uncharacterized protein